MIPPKVTRAPLTTRRKFTLAFKHAGFRSIAMRCMDLPRGTVMHGQSITAHVEILAAWEISEPLEMTLGIDGFDGFASTPGGFFPLVSRPVTSRTLRRGVTAYAAACLTHIPKVNGRLRFVLHIKRQDGALLQFRSTDTVDIIPRPTGRNGPAVATSEPTNRIGALGRRDVRDARTTLAFLMCP